MAVSLRRFGGDPDLADVRRLDPTEWAKIPLDRKPRAGSRLRIRCSLSATGRVTMSRVPPAPHRDRARCAGCGASADPVGSSADDHGAAGGEVRLTAKATRRIVVLRSQTGLPTRTRRSPRPESVGGEGDPMKRPAATPMDPANSRRPACSDRFSSPRRPDRPGTLPRSHRASPARTDDDVVLVEMIMSHFWPRGAVSDTRRRRHLSRLPAAVARRRRRSGHVPAAYRAAMRRRCRFRQTGP